MTIQCWCGGLVDSGRCQASEFHDPEMRETEAEPRVLYIAGPMSGYPECNYPAFYSAADKLRSVGYLVVNPADTGAEGGQYTDLIKKDLQLLLDCDGVAVIEKWWESVGARNEVCNAGILKKPVRSVDEWIARALPRKLKDTQA